MARKRTGRVEETYFAKTFDWRGGFFFKYTATWLMYQHDPSAREWLAVAMTGVVYVRFVYATPYVYATP